MGAVQSAYGYAQDLNESLNNIRIVTGQSVEEMDRFAERANRAAKLLSTTTVEYTDAALIYYQQGLTDEQVAERTAVTVKMANAAGQSAEVVSDQLTAVWNNFYDGSKALEYYADVMTALGAATASSTDEIAGGLEKFAAIADTIGLSYEYAASALATITSNTRQSEEVVGTALKTIFARIQGLNLGETLEDGTTLNKYSKALDAVGINIFDANKNIKSMDTLLDEIAVKWQQISKDQQIALAQTVAGTRQYTQLVALMDNWNNGDNDSMVANLSTARGSEGTLTEQAEIYAESWEAASDRVTAAAENIYDSLLNDDFFITILNGFEDILTAIGGFIDGLGGMEGALSLVGSIFLKMYANKMPDVLNNLKQNLMVFTGQAKKSMNEMQVDLDFNIEKAKSQSSSESYRAELEGTKRINDMKNMLINTSKKLSESEKEAYQLKIKNVEKMNEEVVALIKQKEALEETLEAKKKLAEQSAKDEVKSTTKDFVKAMDQKSYYENKYQEVQSEINSIVKKSPENTSEEDLERLTKLTLKADSYYNAMLKAEEEATQLEGKMENIRNTYGLKENVFDDIILGNANELDEEAQATIDEKITGKINNFKNISQNATGMNQLTESLKNQSKAWIETADAINNYSEKTDNIEKISAETNDLKQNMVNYLNDIKESANKLGVTFSRDINIDNFINELEGMDATKAASEFEILSNKIINEFNVPIKTAIKDLQDLRIELSKMGVEPIVLQDIDITIEKLSKVGATVKSSERNVNNFSKDAPKGVKHLSTTFMDLNSTLLDVNAVINSVSNSFRVLTDENASGLEKLGAIIGTLTSVMALLNSASKLNETLNIKNTIATIFNTKAEVENAAATAKAGASKLFKAKVVGKNTIAMIKETKVLKALTNGFKALGSVGLSVLLSEIALISVAISKLYQSYQDNNQEVQLERAKKVTEGMKDAAIEAKDKYLELQNTFNEYDSAVDKLNSLTVGTEEFTSALIEANNKAKELIETYNLLPEDYYIGENGELVIKDESQDKYEDQARKDYEQTQALYASAQLIQNQKQNTANAYDYETNSIYSATQIEAIVQAILDAGYKDVTDFYSSTTDEERTDFITKELGKLIYEFTEEDLNNPENIELINSYNSEDIQQIKDFGLMQYVQDTYPNQQERKGIIQQSLITGLEDEKFYQDFSYKNFLIDQMSNIDNYDTKVAEILASKEYQDMSPDDIANAFLNALPEGYTLDGEDVKDSEGNVVENLSELDDDGRLEYLAGMQALTDLNDEAINFIDRINEITKELSEEDKKIANMILGKDYSNISYKEAQQYKDLDVNEFIESNSWLKEIEGAEILVKEFKLAMENYTPGAVDLSSTIKSFNEVKKSVSEIEFGEIIDKEQFDALGEEANQFFTDMGDGTYKLTGDAQEFYNVIMGIKMSDLIASIKEGVNQLNYLKEKNAELQYLSFDEKVALAAENGVISDDLKRRFDEGLADDEDKKIVEDYINNLIEENMNEIESSEASLKSSAHTAFSSANNMEELQGVSQQLADTGLNQSYIDDSYITRLTELTNKYEYCTDIINDYREAIKSGTDAEKEAVKTQMELALSCNELAEEYDLDAESLYNLIDSIEIAAHDSEIFSEDLIGNKKALMDAAKQLSRYNKAVESASENMEDWKDALNSKDISKSTKAISQLKDAYADMFDLSADDFSDQFVSSAENLALMEEALQGSEDAYNNLQAAIAVDIIEKEFRRLPGITQEVLNEITAQKLEAGDIINIKENTLADQLAGLYNQAVLTAIRGGMEVADAMEQANALMQAIGYEPPEVDWEAKTVTITGELPEGWIPQPDKTMLGPDGQVLEGVTWESVEGGTYTYTQTMMVPKATSFTKSVENLGGSSYSSKGGGGGGSKPKKAEAPKKSDTVDRYKEIDDKLSENTRSMNKAEKAAEGLWGPERFDKMREGIELLEEENKLLEERLGWSKQYLEEDRAALDKAAAEAGITFTFNADGRISNYTSEMTKLYNELEAATNAANADGNATEEEQEHLDKLQEKIDAVSEAVETYDSTLDEYISDEEQMMENQLEIWEKNLDLLDQELELEIGINESDLEKLEYLLSKVEDNAYDMYEAAALMVGKVDEDGNFDTSGSQLGVYLKELQDYEDHYNKLVESYQNEDISKPQFIEELQNLQSELYDNLGSIQELDETMVHYYGDTLDAAADELSQFTDLMEHHNDVLDHYNNLMELLGNSKDYDRLDEILRSQVAVAENMTEVSKANYEMLAAEAAAREQAWQSAQMNVTMSEYEKEMLKQQWLDAQNAANEAQDQMLSDAEAWAEALKAVLENELSSLSDILNNALSGEFNSLDEMNEAIERKNSLQEEYLTKTNQIYETDKLMRTAQQAIDKSTNDVAKRRLKQFIDETDALQNQTKLSEYELEIQQAKYDLLLAEIALEEAQNAKSTVRLQRDSEGNFGYVYTADQNAVAEAEQELADAQNRLYNIGLEGANDYTQKYLDTLTEMNDELTALTEAWINNEISSWEEYERRKNELTEYYGEKMEQYNDLHGIALTTDTAVVVDAWTSGFADMTDRTKEWMTAVDDYVGKVRDAFSEYESELDKIEEETVGPDLESLEDKTEAITKANEKLVESITQENGILDALAQEITSVQNLAEEYAKLRKEIQGTIDDSEGLAKTANDLQHTESDDDPTNDMNYKAPAPEPVETPKSPTQETPNEQPQPKTVAAGAQVNAGSAKIYGQPGVGGGSQYYSNDPVYDVLEVDGEWVRVRHHSLSSGTSGWFKKSDLTAFDSGGYTGDWGGPYGKLAMLHKKELILNEHDTDNFLLTMEVMERILQMLDLQTMSSQFGGLLSSPGLRDTGSQSLEQHIEIEAHFPDATDRIEIEEAFKSMVNLASQYANRK